jgi:hypothetical protein
MWAGCFGLQIATGLAGGMQGGWLAKQPPDPVRSTEERLFRTLRSAPAPAGACMGWECLRVWSVANDALTLSGTGEYTGGCCGENSVRVAAIPLPGTGDGLSKQVSSH